MFYNISNGRYLADNFVTRYERELWLGEFTVDDVQVGPAYGAGADAKEKVPGNGFRYRQIGQSQRLSGCFKKHRAHRPSAALQKATF